MVDEKTAKRGLALVFVLKVERPVMATEGVAANAAGQSYIP